MKKLSLLIVLLNLNLFTIYSQASVCESPEETIDDINTISIKKCEISENKKKARKIIKTKTVRKRVISKSTKRSPNLSKKLLFTLVQEIPMFESCVKSNRKNDVKCFKAKVNEHFSKKFNADKFINQDIDKKVYMQFSIDLRGRVIDTKIKSKKINTLLHKELNKIMNELPRFTPGREKGLPVIVTYSFPLNLTFN
ncbi:hypothetical protein [Tenacibaculum ovolyticum]|uniref:hypothetical protein n=2 Tax=Tenacibaculum ovolyticum TaxID=104270 RepID=UPI0007ED17DB|nr:hypothetical protein [Tenacibaculum ovolyticum]